jgi:hypothetical protein
MTQMHALPDSRDTSARPSVHLVSGDLLGRIPEMWATLTAWEKLQIEQAAAGCVSGTLREWPLLRIALISIGVPDSKELRNCCSGHLRDMCAAIVALVPNKQGDTRPEAKP